MSETQRKAARLRVLGSALLTLTAMIWGTAFVAQRVGMERIEPLTFSAARMALAAVAVGLLAAILARREKPRPDARQVNKNSLVGGILCGAFLAAASIFQQMGIVTTTAGKAGFITALYMLLVPIFATIFFHKKNGWLVWLAVGIGVVGMYLLCVTESFTLTRGDALVCVCAVLFSGHILCCDHFAPRAEPIRMSAIQFASATVICAIAAFIAEQPSWEKVASAAVPILYCGLVSGGVGYTLQIVAQRWTDPTVASLLMSLESVFAVLAGALLIGERMSPREAAGCAIMFLAILLVQIPTGRRKKPSPSGEGGSPKD